MAPVTPKTQGLIQKHPVCVAGCSAGMSHKRDVQTLHCRAAAKGRMARVEEPLRCPEGVQSRSHHRDDDRNPRSERPAAEAICVQFSRTLHGSKSECTHTRAFTWVSVAVRVGATSGFVFEDCVDNVLLAARQDGEATPRHLVHQAQLGTLHTSLPVAVEELIWRCPHAAVSSQVCFESLPSSSF